jgi:hypothetical protein
MNRTTIGGLFLIALALALVPATTHADPCLMVYPGDGVVVYHYEPTEYYTVGPLDSLYDAMYDRGGEVLIDINTDVIAYDVYQVPGLAGFMMDSAHQGYFTMSPEMTLIVDGYSGTPTSYTNILLVFDLIEPLGCSPVITIDGNPVLWDAGLGWYLPIGDLVVSTPQGLGYSDVLTFDFLWTGCTTVRIWAFADDNFDMIHNGGECFSAYSHDLVVPVEETTWGAVKSLYAD